LYFPDGLVARIVNLRFNSYDAQVESRATETRIFGFNSIFAQDHTAAALPDQAQITIDVIGPRETRTRSRRYGHLYSQTIRFRSSCSFRHPYHHVGIGNQKRASVEMIDIHFLV